METRRENRPASRSGASGLPAFDMRLPGTGSGKPCARDPPSPDRTSYQRHQQGLQRACHGNPPGEDLPMLKATKGEAMRQHRLSRTPDLRS
jgi:hypothetical protein